MKGVGENSKVGTELLESAECTHLSNCGHTRGGDVDPIFTFGAGGHDYQGISFMDSSRIFATALITTASIDIVLIGFFVVFDEQEIIGTSGIWYRWAVKGGGEDWDGNSCSHW